MSKKISVKVIEYPQYPYREIHFSSARIICGKVGKMRNKNCVVLNHHLFKGLFDLKELPNNIPVRVITSNGEFTVNHVSTKLNCCLPMPLCSVLHGNGGNLIKGEKIKYKILGLIINPDNRKVTALF